MNAPADTVDVCMPAFVGTKMAGSTVHAPGVEVKNGEFVNRTFMTTLAAHAPASPVAVCL